MVRCTRLLRRLWRLTCTLLTLLADAARFRRLCLRFPTALAAENLFLRKQLALYQECQVTPRRATNTTRFALAWLSCWFDWHQALVLVQPATLLHWHWQGFRLLWRWKPRAGRPSIPTDLHVLIRRMAQENPT
jgi:putative transposase